MQDTSSKWLAGCGIGCAAIIVLIVIVAFGGYLALRPTIDQFGSLKDTYERLEAQHGDIIDFRPSRDGAIAASRIEAFLEVRRRTETEALLLKDSVNGIEKRIKELDQGGGSPLKVARMVITGMGLIPEFAGFQERRLSILSDQDMGLGEYLYIYTIAYYAWLEKPPDDGPTILRLNEHPQRSRSPWPREEEEEDEEEDRLFHIIREIRGMHLAILNATLEEAENAPDKYEPEWVEAMTREQKELRRNLGRIPWSDGMPAAMTRSLEPFRAQFERGYSPFANALEMLSFNH